MVISDNATPHKAAEYDASVRKTIPFYEEIQKQVIDVARTIKPEAGCWLDTGCGTGYLVKLAVPYFPQTSFVLTDSSPAMLELAKKTLINTNRVKFLPPIGNQNLNVYKGEVHPQIVTAILCNHYLNSAGRKAATESSYHLLEEHGLFITVENISPVAEENIVLGLERWKRFQLEQGKPLSVVDDHIKRFNTEYFPITIDEHIDLLKLVGFRNVNLFWMSYMQAGFYAVK